MIMIDYPKLSVLFSVVAEECVMTDFLVPVGGDAEGLSEEGGGGGAREEGREEWEVHEGTVEREDVGDGEQRSPVVSSYSLDDNCVGF